MAALGRQQPVAAVLALPDRQTAMLRRMAEAESSQSEKFQRRKAQKGSF